MRRLVLVLALVVSAWLPGAAPATADSGPWGWPLAGPREVSREFAPPQSRYGAGHRGADLPAMTGAVVRAAGAGQVSYAGLLAGRGVVVVVHGGLRTTYEPVSASVSVGDVVALGEPLGQLDGGHLGCPFEACLHWGLRRGEVYLDPVRLVEAGPVRLLPVGPAAGGVASTGVPGEVVRGVEGDGVEGDGVKGDGVDGDGVDGRGVRPRLAPAASSSPSPVPLGALAVAALVAGVGLLARPRTDPPPASGPSVLTAGSTSPDDLDQFGPEQTRVPQGLAHQGVVDLDVQRLHRRAV